MDEKGQSIKQDLEIFYDVPFEVSMRMEYKDPVYCITPQNYLGELFEVKIHFRQKIRMIVEIEPQKYAASPLLSCRRKNRDLSAYGDKGINSI